MAWILGRDMEWLHDMYLVFKKIRPDIFWAPDYKISLGGSLFSLLQKWGGYPVITHKDFYEYIDSMHGRLPVDSALVSDVERFIGDYSSVRVLRLLVRDYRIQEISAMLSISDHTVRHTRHIMQQRLAAYPDDLFIGHVDHNALNGRARLVDYTGTRHGAFTVVRRLAWGSWLCRCDCGQTVKKNTCDLVHGGLTNCGCNPLAKYKWRMSPDITGKRYGHLVALERINIARWLMHCDCGKTIERNYSDLMDPRRPNQHCGCLTHGRRARALETNRRFRNAY